MLATAFLSRAPVLLLDEPFADLDDEGRDLVARAMRGRVEGGSVIVVATPQIEDASIAHRTLALDGGELEVMT
jgi:ABC-type multidrug transport system ATPase subunit